MTMRRPSPPRPLALLAGLALAACSATPEPRFYLLGGGELPAAAPAPRAERVIGLREIALPLYARRAQIPVLEADGAIAVSDLHRWAEEPPRAVSRLVARTVAAETGATVVVEPWGTEIVPDLRVDIAADYLIGALGGELRLDGEVRLFRRGDPGSAITRPFAIREPLGGESHADLVDAHARALTALGRLVAADLRRLDAAL